VITLSETLKEAVAQTVTEMLQSNEVNRAVVGFPSTMASFVKPDGNVFSELQGKDLDGVFGIKADQKVYIYQEG
jgi:hypothetical protein